MSLGGSFAHPRRVERRFTVAPLALDNMVGFNGQDLHILPPASVGASSAVDGEDCGWSGVAHDVVGAGRG
jgi:hypothetical protein